MARALIASFAFRLAFSPVSSDPEVARVILCDLLSQSFRENVEYCGYIGFDEADGLVASDATRGGSDWCEMELPEGIEIVSYYHTHAACDPIAWSKILSDTDMESDQALGIDGNVSSPGGRLWYIDTPDMAAFQMRRHSLPTDQAKLPTCA